MFLQQAKFGDNRIVFYAIALLGIPFGYILGSLPLDFVIRWAINNHDDIMPTAVDEFYGGNPDFSLFHIDKNIGLILMISIFIGVLVILFLVIKFLHKRPFKTLITANPTIDYRKIFFAFSIWMILSVIFEIGLFIYSPDNYTFNFELKSFVILLLIGLFILPIQTTAEELVFRGYLLQGIVHFYKAPWLALLITSILFGFIHGQNPEITKYGVLPMQMYYVSAGLFLGIITIFDDGLELAIGVHAATNFFGAVVSTYEGSVLQTDSLFKSSFVNPWIALCIFITASVIFMLICAKKYKWGSVNSLFKKLDTINVDHEA